MIILITINYNMSNKKYENYDILPIKKKKKNQGGSSKYSRVVIWCVGGWGFKLHAQPLPCCSRAVQIEGRKEGENRYKWPPLLLPLRLLYLSDHFSPLFPLIQLIM